MVRSMTGFGRGECRSGQYLVRAEIRSVNNRNLRVSFRLPDRLQGLEGDLEKLMREAVARGTLTVGVTYDDLSGDAGFVLDAAVIRHYRDALRELDCEQENVPMSVLVTLPGAIRRKTVEEVPDELAQAVMAAIRQAVAAFIAARETEGAFIWKDMMARCRAISTLVDRVEARIPGMVEEYRRRLSERLAKLLSGVGSHVTEEDVRKEVAFFADRSDISEEITRLRSHLALMDKAGASDEPSGRKLEFIMQEMFREANTMGSKASDASMIHDVLDIKGEVEKLREQALNVE